MHMCPAARASCSSRERVGRHGPPRFGSTRCAVQVVQEVGGWDLKRERESDPRSPLLSSQGPRRRHNDNVRPRSCSSPLGTHTQWPTPSVSQATNDDGEVKGEGGPKALRPMAALLLVSLALLLAAPAGTAAAACPYAADGSLEADAAAGAVVLDAAAYAAAGGLVAGVQAALDSNGTVVVTGPWNAFGDAAAAGAGSATVPSGACGGGRGQGQGQACCSLRATTVREGSGGPPCGFGCPGCAWCTCAGPATARGT